jgi:hypothetical protein
MAHSDSASKLIRIKHSKNIHTHLENLREIMNLVNQEFEATAEQYRHLAAKSINQNDLRKYVKAVFGVEGDDAAIWPVGNQKRDKEIVSERMKGIMEEVFSLVETGPGNNLPSIRGTWWQAYQGVNAYLNYSVGNNQDNRLNNLWFGKGANQNREALAMALQLAV